MVVAAAGLSRSEHWNVNTLIPLARQRENPSCPDVPCERRTSPADPTHPSPPIPIVWRETSSLSLLPPGACPFNPFNPILPQSSRISNPSRDDSGPSRSGTEPERALERQHPHPPRAPARKPLLSRRSLRAQDQSRGPNPRTQPTPHLPPTPEVSEPVPYPSGSLSLLILFLPKPQATHK